MLFTVPSCFRTRAALQAEILALRHQLLLLQRSNLGHKVRLGSADRALWVWLSRLWTEWRSALIIVKPETVIGWHRQGFRLYWRWKSLSLAKSLAAFDFNRIGVALHRRVAIAPAYDKYPCAPRGIDLRPLSISPQLASRKHGPSSTNRGIKTQTPETKTIGAG